MSTSILNIAPATPSEPATPRLSIPRRTTTDDSSDVRADSPREKDAVSFHELVERSAGRPTTDSSSEKPEGEPIEKAPAVDRSVKEDATIRDAVNSAVIVPLDPALAATIGRFDRSQPGSSAFITDACQSLSTTGGIAAESQLTTASIAGRSPSAGTVQSQFGSGAGASATTIGVSASQIAPAGTSLSSQPLADSEDGAWLNHSAAAKATAGEHASLQTEGEILSHSPIHNPTAEDAPILSDRGHTNLTTASTVAAASGTAEEKTRSAQNKRDSANAGVESELAIGAGRNAATGQTVDSAQPVNVADGNKVSPVTSSTSVNVGDRSPETEAGDIASTGIPEVKDRGTNEPAQFTSQLDQTGLSSSHAVAATRETAYPVAHSLAQRITQQIAETIVTRAATTEFGDSVTLDAVLDPPDLGRLHVRLTRSDSGLKAIVSAENGDVHQVITEHAASIERMVRTHLKSNEPMQFLTSDTPNHHGSASQHGDEQPQRTARLHRGFTRPNETVESPRPLRSTRSEIDVLA